MILAAGLRESVILDAADEAIYKASRRASRNLTPLFDNSTPSTSTSSAGSPRTDMEQSASTMGDEMLASFRWMDEERDLDLKLAAYDNYHANVHGVVLPTPSSDRRPSFRRQMSISKMPFGRNSLSSLGPRSPKFEPFTNNHGRQKSRTLSLIAPESLLKDSILSIDPNATHYQDPEARMKLRVYLASPQKFDEAIEFGFPSMDGVTDKADKEHKAPKRSSKDVTRSKKSYSTEGGQSFLNDDNLSLFEDDVSMNDPESPLTPMGAETEFRSHHRPLASFGSKDKGTSVDFSHLGITKPIVVKQQDSYAQAMAGSREMTLRMTLTRPDLRADENTIYGWQGSKSPLREASLALDEDEKYTMRGPFGGSDGWGPVERENGGFKRFWNKVRSSQRKSS